ncbi:MAG: signal peptide peptidase SppA [Kiloniellaceae bacterium]
MRVVLFLLKCLVGLFAAIGFVLIAGVAALAVLWDRIEPLRATLEPVPEAVVLTLDLTTGMIEVRPDNPLARASLGRVPVLRETLEALEAAGADPQVRGLLVRVGRGRSGLARIQELRDAILDFRGGGKVAVAFAESFGEGGDGTLHYYLASAFDRIWLQPSGGLDVTGFRLENPFVREALNEIGVQPRLDQRGEFKGAMNLFTDSALPEAQRRNLQRLVDSWLAQVARGVAEQRGLAEPVVRAAIDRAPYSAGEALDHGLVDRVGYWDEAKADALAAAGLDAAEDGVPFLPLADYDARRERPEPEGPAIALIHGLGPVVLDRSENDPLFGTLIMGADTVAQALRDAMDDPEVRAVVFRVDSPGGSYVASDVIWREMRRARDKGLPVVVTMGDVAASGGYFVAAPARAIVAQPGTVTGSIGVVGGKMVMAGLWQRLGVAWDGVQAGERAAYWSANHDFSPAEWAKLQDSLDRIYADFTRKVAEGRDLPLDKVLAAAEGRVWSGEDAQALGLVDALGGYRTAFALARKAAGVDPGQPVRIKVFPEERDPFEALIEDALAGQLGGAAVRSLARALARVSRALAPVVEAVEALSGDSRRLSLSAPRVRPAN